MRILIISILVQIISLQMMAQDYKKVDEATGIELGSKAPMFEAIDAHGENFSLQQTLNDGPVVLIFYRGLWCPHCNRHLSLIQDSLAMIQETGAQVVAVSAQKMEYLAEMEAETGATYPIVSDESFQIADAYGVSFKPSGMTVAMYNSALNAKLKKSQTDDTQRLPIPATYIISKQGEIAWRQFDPDYKNRSSVKDIITALSNL